MPRQLLHKADLAGLADFAVRRFLRAWDLALGDPDNDEVLEEFHAALALVNDVIVVHVPFDYDPRPFIAANTWVYAKTMPKNPHEYVVLRAATDWREQLRFGRWIRHWGETERFDGRPYKYMDVDDHHYWVMSINDTIINRKRLEDLK
jgi:hypothetical protein